MANKMLIVHTVLGYPFTRELYQNYDTNIYQLVMKFCVYQPEL